jgi:glycosyltransferase involved in cell wall biosynthesis
MKYDLIIVTKSSTKELIQVTQNCINSARADNPDMNVIIVETSEYAVKYDRIDQVIKYEGDFNYNRALNLGLKYAIGDVHILANNDIVFMPGWSHIADYMLLNDFDSASALSEDRRQLRFRRGDWIYEGYEVGSYIAGWCIFCTRKCIETIGKLDESFDFWYSDNVYADQLIKANIKHGLFCNVHVNHVTSQTLKTVAPNTRKKYTYEPVVKYQILKKIRDAS